MTFFRRGPPSDHVYPQPCFALNLFYYFLFCPSIWHCFSAHVLTGGLSPLMQKLPKRCDFALSRPSGADIRIGTYGAILWPSLCCVKACWTGGLRNSVCSVVSLEHQQGKLSSKGKAAFPVQAETLASGKVLMTVLMSSLICHWWKCQTPKLSQGVTHG